MREPFSSRWQVPHLSSCCRRCSLISMCCRLPFVGPEDEGRTDSEWRMCIYFRCFDIGCGSTRTPHLLELDTDFSKRFDDDSDEDILEWECLEIDWNRPSNTYFDQPSEKENHRNKVEERSPRWKTIDRPIHEKDPTFLTSRFVDGEETRR